MLGRFVTPTTSDGESVVDDDIEVAVERTIDELGFMLHAPINSVVCVQPLYPVVVASEWI